MLRSLRMTRIHSLVIVVVLKILERSLIEHQTQRLIEVIDDRFDMYLVHSQLHVPEIIEHQSKDEVKGNLSLLDCSHLQVQWPLWRIVGQELPKQEMIPIVTIDVCSVYKAFERMFLVSYIQDNFLELIIVDFNYEVLVNIDSNLIWHSMYSLVMDHERSQLEEIFKAFSLENW